VDDFEEFFVARRDIVFRVVRVAVGDPMVAEDAMAEAFSRAFAQWSTVGSRPDPSAWVYPDRTQCVGVVVASSPAGAANR
jgi:DNA-directed RNA polymerase specialized sigma24 family protein